MSCVKDITSRAAVNAPPKPPAAVAILEFFTESFVGGLQKKTHTQPIKHSNVSKNQHTLSQL